MKVGDKVKVKSAKDIIELQKNDTRFQISYNHRDMKKYSGNVYTIKKVDRIKNHLYHHDIFVLDINERQQSWIWDERWLIPITELPEDLFTL